MIITDTSSIQVFDAILRTNDTYAPSELQVTLLKEGEDIPTKYIPTGIVYNTNSVEITYEVDIQLRYNENYLLTLNELSTDKLLFRDKVSILSGGQENYSFITNDSNDNFVVIGDVEGGGDKNYVHHQSSASATWNVNHSLGKFSSVTVVDSANTVVQGQIQFVDANNVILIFSSAFSGRAYFN